MDAIVPKIIRAYSEEDLLKSSQSIEGELEMRLDVVVVMFQQLM